MLFAAVQLKCSSRRVKDGHAMNFLFRYRELIRNLVLERLKLNYDDSTIGFLWSLLNPLRMLFYS